MPWPTYDGSTCTTGPRDRPDVTRVFLAVLNASGDLDRTFGVDGIVRARFLATASHGAEPSA
jgi:hypothetical protein